VHLAAQVMHFARALRHAGLPLGTDRIALAQQALQVAGQHSRAEFHAVLCACLLDRHEHQLLFDQVFELFWQHTGLLERVLQCLAADPAADQPPAQTAPAEPSAPSLARPRRHADEDGDALTVDGVLLAASASERLRQVDFESMSSEEFRAALRLLPQLRRAFPPRPTRRRSPSPRQGRVDLRATLRMAGRQGGEWDALRFTAPREVVPPLVVLADISGSMSRYSRMLLHFAHLLGLRPGRHSPRVETFVFGTRLTRITPWLRQRDPDVAVARVTAGVQDWSGGTRITESLHEFNQRWARRVLGGRATVLLVTDGLEHGPTEALAFEMDRLHKSCHRLLWLNPLLRFARFEPRAAGIRTMLPHVDRFLPVHNLNSLEALLHALQQPVAPVTPGRGMI
jgi:uncharacterized protein with von Willebrand factor type A (vWA) domain